ncbi:MAG: aminomethyltransferase [Rhodopirellula sp.]|nr:aminomethyltransferase [Rhodopirellula sp.]
MKQFSIYRLDHLSVVEVTGADASTILHNLTTNEVRSLSDLEGRETFVTDVRGKMLGHVCLFRHRGGLRLVGPAGQSEAICSHIDRYTIREDATAEIQDSEFVGFVITPELAAEFGFGSHDEVALRSFPCDTEIEDVTLQEVRWLGQNSFLLCLPVTQAERALDILSSLVPVGSKVQCTDLTKQHVGSETAFHQARVVAGFPWYGVDLDESNLPQEADRDSETISFTKGCYLGQETVARLDAMGQVQKKLVRWEITGGVPAPGTSLLADEKKVARLTSVASTEEHGVLAIGFSRRSHFEKGASAIGVIESDAGEAPETAIHGTVL